MRIEIVHEVRYAYSAPVFFEPHTFFFRPREDGRHRLLRFDLSVDPAPSLCHPFLDPCGNNPSKAWFTGTHDRLTVRAHSEVEVSHANPFDYIIEQNSRRLPLVYEPEFARALEPYQRPAAVSGAARVFSDRIASRVENTSAYFLTALCAEIYAIFKKIHRPEGAPRSAEETIQKQEGACRDLAVLFVECCRHQGLAARFTSGYYAVEEEMDRELHAWAEVYLEGAGWTGFDPTAGLACGERHVPVASSLEPVSVPPVLGTFRGTGITSTLETRVLARTVAEGALS